VAISIANRTYSRCSKTVSTVKKSTASTPFACARRNCRHVMADRVGAGSTPARCRMVHRDCPHLAGEAQPAERVERRLVEAEGTPEPGKLVLVEAKALEECQAVLQA
jgi:hypothetical protein